MLFWSINLIYLPRVPIGTIKTPSALLYAKFPVAVITIKNDGAFILSIFIILFLEDKRHVNQ